MPAHSMPDGRILGSAEPLWGRCIRRRGGAPGWTPVADVSKVGGYSQRRVSQHLAFRRHPARRPVTDTYRDKTDALAWPLRPVEYIRDELPSPGSQV